MKTGHYGFPCVSNPNDFSPDPESSTEEEIEQHRKDCEAYNNGTYTHNSDNHSGWVSNSVHVLRTPWGIGVSMIESEEV
jgi:hypothetical protein